jgi:hypothetical protein
VFCCWMIVASKEKIIITLIVLFYKNDDWKAIDSDGLIGTSYFDLLAAMAYDQVEWLNWSEINAMSNDWLKRFDETSFKKIISDRLLNVSPTLFLYEKPVSLLWSYKDIIRIFHFLSYNIFFMKE